MPSSRTYIDPRHRMVYKYIPRADTVIAISDDGAEISEKMSTSLAERLTAQGVPPVLWKGSKGATTTREIPSLSD